MKFSIITICFNNENGIAQTINTVINQTYPNIEYLIVDGASKDKILDIVKSFGIKFPMTNCRLHNMTTDNINDLSRILTVAKNPFYTRLEGIRQKISYLNNTK